VLSPGNARSGTPPTITLLAYGQRTRYIFNGDGLLVEIVGEICSDATYATWEECTDAEVPSWTTSLQFEYDADERPIRIIDQDGNSRTFAYDDADNLITYQTASGRTYNYAYDAAQRLTSITGATGVKLLFGYDTRDNLLGICRTRIDFSGDYAACTAQTNLTDGSGLLESYGYDTLDRLVQRTFPSAGGITNVPYEYDESGRLTAIGSERFSYNTLDLLDHLDTDGSTYDFSYHTLNQVAQAGDLEFVYDNTGRVIGYTSGGQTFSLLYSNDSLYSLQDSFGNRLEYAVDERGFLSGLNYNGDNLIQLEYIYDEHEPGINLYWNSAEPTTITSTINRKKETQSQQFDGAGYFTLFYDITPTGLVQRHDMTTLPGRSEGYVVVQGYDNDERPLTMRVTDAAGLQVLYTQTITYNTAGLRTGEQLQYADGTRVIKSMTYQDNSQLASQSVLIIRPLQLASAAVWFLPLFLLRRRRGRILVAALLLGVIALPLLRAQTAQTEERYEFTYNYDAQGNLSHVDLVDPSQTCARFEYDGANRLTQVERGDFAASYDYDAYDRVTSINDDTGTTTLSYQGSTSRILSVMDEEQQMYYMQTADQPAFAALDVSGAVTWLITDGRERIYQTYHDGDNPRKDLWLFDPLGRVLTLQPPAEGDDFNPCVLGGTRTVPSNVRLQSDPKGFVWDASATVYFYQGRAYDAEVGRYLQRDPNGPDALGNVYDGWTRQNVPTVQKETPVYAEGLTILRDAMNAIRINDQLTADAVKARTLPSGSRTLDPVTTMTQNARQPFDETVNGLANLPLWLQTNYNLPAPSVDTMGRYTIPQALAPGQGGTRTPFTAPYDRMLPTWDDMAMKSIKSPIESFTALASRVTQPPTPDLRVYDASAWMPQPLTLVDFWQQPMAAVDRQFTPESVLDLLPRTLAAPDQAAYTLDTVAFLYSLPERPAYKWISDALTNAMPQRPDLPPQTLSQWEEDWFREDLFGLGELAKKIKPPQPFIPFYEWGDTPDWLHILK
jgi:YD repeat-containing protein